MESLGLSYDLKERYYSTASLLDEAPSTLKSYKITSSEDDLQLLLNQYEKLDFVYDASELSDDARKFCAHHKYRVDSLRQVIRVVLSENLVSLRRTLVEENEVQIDGEIDYDFFVPKGTKVYVDYKVSAPANGRLYNKDTHAALRTWSKKKEVCDSVAIPADGIYVWQIKVKGEQYLTLDVSKNFVSVEELDKHYEMSYDNQ